MIYSIGIHLEFKNIKIKSSPPATIAFVADASQAEVIRLLVEQTAALTVKSFIRNRLYRDRSNRNNSRYRPRNDRDRNDRYRGDRINREHTERNDRDRNDTRVWDGCGKTGHVFRKCPTFTDTTLP